jgi:hypothetical protein
MEPHASASPRFASGKTGEMEIHAHDAPQVPILLGVNALRKLGAVIDYEANTMILKNVDAVKVISLEQSRSGHQLLPLTGDVFAQATDRETPFLSLLE